MDILLNNDRTSLDFGDAIFINGPLSPAGITQEPAEVVAQRLSIMLRTFKGEWFLDTQYGIAYFQRILGKKVSKAGVDRIFQENILKERGVTQITFFSSSLVNRVYELSFRVKVSSGQETENITLSTQI